MLKLRIFLGFLMLISGIGGFLLCVSLPSSPALAAAVTALTGIEAAILSKFALMSLALAVLSLCVFPPPDQFHRAAEKKKARKALKAVKLADNRRRDATEAEMQDVIRNAIMAELETYGSVLELDMLPYPIAESEQAAQRLLKEDARLRFGEFTREDRTITKAIWIARHLK